jgi:hypothetical protein
MPSIRERMRSTREHGQHGVLTERSAGAYVEETLSAGRPGPDPGERPKPRCADASDEQPQADIPPACRNGCSDSLRVKHFPFCGRSPGLVEPEAARDAWIHVGGCTTVKRRGGYAVTCTRGLSLITRLMKSAMSGTAKRYLPCRSR